VRIVATLYDNAGKVIGTDFTFTDVNVLRPAEKSSFKIILSDLGQSQKVTSYKLSTSAVRTQALPASLRLTIGESHLDTIGAYHIGGKVTNHGSQKATFVKVSGAFYNRTNVVVAADYTYTEPKDLESGQTAPFEIIVTSATYAHQITYASLNADSIQYSVVGHNETS
jgi:hypothetical protein